MNALNYILDEQWKILEGRKWEEKLFICSVCVCERERERVCDLVCFVWLWFCVCIWEDPKINEGLYHSEGFFLLCTGCSLNIVFFPYNVVIFLNSAIVLLQRWSSTCHLWSPMYTPRKNREGPESGIYFEIFKKTQYLMNFLYVTEPSEKDDVREWEKWLVAKEVTYDWTRKPYYYHYYYS